MIKVDLVTGILGSGKTTFIKKYAEYLIKNKNKIAIIENDFGAVNVDMMLLQSLESEMCQLEMVAGGGDPDCHKRRFKTKLITLGMLGFDRVVVEPSGIFDMDEFFDTLREEPLDRWYEAGSVISVVDGELEELLSSQTEFLLGSESACAGAFVLSKFNYSNSAKQINSVINHINKSLDFISCDRKIKKSELLAKDWNDFSDEEFNMLTNCGYQNREYVKLYSKDDILSSTHYVMHVRMNTDDIAKTIKGIFNDSECGKIYRIKGFVKKEDKWLEINSTQSKFTVRETSCGQEVFIIIGDNVSISAVDKYFIKVNLSDKYVSI